MTADEIAALAPSHIVISPGPCTPNEAGIRLDVIRSSRARSRSSASASAISPSARPSAGRSCARRASCTARPRRSSTTARGCLRRPAEPVRGDALPLAGDRETSVPADLEVTARTADDEIMGVRHRTLPVEGVQFHPESILTTAGKDLLRNFLEPRRAAVNVREALARVVDRQDLTADEMAEVVGRSWTAQATPAQIGGLLVALRMKGETVDELVGAAPRHAAADDRRRPAATRSWSTPAAPAATARGPSTSRPSRRSSSRARGWSSPSTATAPSRRSPARTTCSRRWAWTRRPGPRRRRAACARRSWRFCSRRRTTRRPSTPSARARSSACARCSTCSAR